jgi:predicted O-methyltransferase YrrM
MNLEIERMEGYGEYLVDGYRVNYLFGLNELCQKYIKSNFSILELGVNNGVSTNLFAKYSKSVVAVDIQKTKKFEKVLLNNNNVSFHQMRFSDFYRINRIKFDFIYIDGSHEYEDVKLDIYNSMKFLKKGGIISGHDYNSSCNGVVEAVNENFKNIEIFEDSSWLKKILNE